MLLIFCYLDDLFILRFVYYNFKQQQQQQSQQVSLKLKRLGEKMVFFVIKSEFVVQIGFCFEIKRSSQLRTLLN